MRKRILVVDDEAAMREMMRAIIGCLPGGSDLDVFDYDNADSAIEAIRASEIPFDLVISDLQIPVNLLGLEVIREAHERSPDTKTMLMSGMADLIRLSRLAQAAKADALLSKPFKVFEVCDKIRELLELQEAVLP